MKTLTTDQMRIEYNTLESSRTAVEQVWLRIENYVVPYRGEFYKDNYNETSVEWSNQQVYDSTAIDAHRSLTASIHSGLTSFAYRWFYPKWRDKELHEDHEAVSWLEESGDLVYQALQDSNFDAEIEESYSDETSYGTSFLAKEPVDDLVWEGMNFTSMPIRECYFTQKYDGTVNHFYRRMMLTFQQIVDKFPDCPEHIKESAQNPGKADSREKVIFSVFYREEKKDADTSKLLAPDERPIGYRYFLHSSGELLEEEGGYYEMPVMVTRWRKTNDSVWGNSPAMVAIYDILTLNAYEELIQSYMGKSIDPVYIGTKRGIIGDLDLNAGAYNVIGQMGEIDILPTGNSISEGFAERAQKRASIQKIFFQDELVLKESPAMTATEASIRWEIMNRLLGSTAARIQHSKLTPIVMDTFTTMLRQGALPPMPESVKASGSEMDIIYEGPLMRAQRMESVTSTQRWLEMNGRMAEIYPDVLDIPDMDEVDRYIRESLSIPESLAKDPEAIKKTRDDRAKKRGEAEQAAGMQMQGEALEQMGAGVEKMKAVGAQ